MQTLLLSLYSLAKILCYAAVITGMRPQVEGSGPACDGWMFITRGILPICGYDVAYGGVHGADEWVDLESLQSTTMACS